MGSPKEAPSAAGNWHTGRNPSLAGGPLARPFAQHTVEAPADPARVWDLWSDPGAWPRFYPGLEAVRADGGFKPGAVLRLASGGASQRVELLFLEPGRSFTLLHRFPFATLRLHHRVEPCPLGSRIHLRLDLEGPLGWVYGLARGRAWRAALPPLLRALAKAAQKD